MKQYASAEGMKPPMEWFISVVEPNVTEYRRSPDERTASNAIISAYHFVERVFHWYRSKNDPRLGGAQTEKAFMDELEKRDSDYVLLRIAANPCKHHFMRVPVSGPILAGVSVTEASSDSVYIRDGECHVGDGRAFGKFFDAILPKLRALAGDGIREEGIGTR